MISDYMISSVGKNKANTQAKRHIRFRKSKRPICFRTPAVNGWRVMEEEDLHDPNICKVCRKEWNYWHTDDEVEKEEATEMGNYEYCTSVYNDYRRASKSHLRKNGKVLCKRDAGPSRLWFFVEDNPEVLDHDTCCQDCKKRYYKETAKQPKKTPKPAAKVAVKEEEKFLVITNAFVCSQSDRGNQIDRLNDLVLDSVEGHIDEDGAVCGIVVVRLSGLKPLKLVKTYAIQE